MLGTILSAECRSCLALRLQEWNRLRRLVLSDALTEFLLPSLTRELRATLLAESREWALQAVGDKLWEYSIQAPLKA